MRAVGALLLALLVEPPAGGDALEKKFEELRVRYETGSSDAKDFEFQEAEANEYLRAQGATLPEGVESPWIRFEEGTTVVGATVDLEKFRANLPSVDAVPALVWPRPRRDRSPARRRKRRRNAPPQRRAPRGNGASREPRVRTRSVRARGPVSSPRISDGRAVRAPFRFSRAFDAAWVPSWSSSVRRSSTSRIPA